MQISVRIVGQKRYEASLRTESNRFYNGEKVSNEKDAYLSVLLTAFIDLNERPDNNKNSLRKIAILLLERFISIEYIEVERSPKQSGLRATIIHRGLTKRACKWLDDIQPAPRISETFTTQVETNSKKIAKAEVALELLKRVCMPENVRCFLLEAVNVKATFEARVEWLAWDKVSRLDIKDKDVNQLAAFAVTEGGKSRRRCRIVALSSANVAPEEKAQICLEHFLYDQLEAAAKGKDSIFEGLKLKDGVRFHLFLSKSPKQNTLLFYDQIVEWNFFGLQGGLMKALLPEAIPIESILIGEKCNEKHMQATICERTKEILEAVEIGHNPKIPRIQKVGRNKAIGTNEIKSRHFYWFHGLKIGPNFLEESYRSQKFMNLLNATKMLLPSTVWCSRSVWIERQLRQQTLARVTFNDTLKQIIKGMWKYKARDPDPGLLDENSFSILFDN